MVFVLSPFCSDTGVLSGVFSHYIIGDGSSVPLGLKCHVLWLSCRRQDGLL